MLFRCLSGLRGVRRSQTDCVRQQRQVISKEWQCRRSEEKRVESRGEALLSIHTSYTRCPGIHASRHPYIQAYIAAHMCPCINVYRHVCTPRHTLMVAAVKCRFCKRSPCATIACWSGWQPHRVLKRR